MVTGVTGKVLAMLAVQCVFMVAITPLLIGVIRQVRAKMEGRAGAGVWQPWRDVRKLLRKEPVQAPGSLLNAIMPIVLVTSSLVLCVLLPLICTESVAHVPDDLFVVVSVLLLGTVALALLGLDAGTAFGGMGSSRNMMIAALVEPTVLLSIYALSIPVGTTALSAIVEARRTTPSSVVSVGALALVALVIAIAAETGRLPVDNPSTHLELTMVHEAMVLEIGGRDLAWVELGSWLRLTALMGLVVNLVIPWGVAPEVTVAGLALGAGVLLAKLLVACMALAAVEVFMAKVRLFRVPELLAASFVLAFLAVTASYLVA